jgi:hypothetical protein
MDYDLEPSAVERFRAIAGDFGPVLVPNVMARHLTVIETPIRPS